MKNFVASGAPLRAEGGGRGAVLVARGMETVELGTTIARCFRQLK